MRTDPLTYRAVVVLAALALLTSGCASWGKKEKGAVIGAAAAAPWAP